MIDDESYQYGYEASMEKLKSDLAELALRREVEAMAQQVMATITIYSKKYYYEKSGSYYCGDPLVDESCGPFTLQSLHSKLKELTEPTKTEEQS